MAVSKVISKEDRGLSNMSVRRFYTMHKLGRNCKLTKEEIKKNIVQCASEAGETYGRKMMYGVLQSKGIQIGETKIGNVLREINPNAQKRRMNVARRSLNPKVYKADYFGHKIHFDQNKKLGIFGVVHVCTRDGYSGMIVGHSTMSKKNNIVVYNDIYEPFLRRHGIWDQIRVDGGKEFGLVCHIQDHLQNYRTNLSRKPYYQTKSTDNNIIERIWVEVNAPVNYPIKRILSNLVASDKIDMTNSVTKFCISWVSKVVAKWGMTNFVESWNHHRIPRKGIPNSLALRNSQFGKVPIESIQTTEQAINHFEQIGGGKLKKDETYGNDPLEGYIHLQVIRKERFYQMFKSDRDIFTAIMQNNPRIFENALSHFQNLTIDLSQRI